MVTNDDCVSFGRNRHRHSLILNLRRDDIYRFPEISRPHFDFGVVTNGYELGAIWGKDKLVDWFTVTFYVANLWITEICYCLKCILPSPFSVM